ncbi:MAG: EscN/YscN/HrcN family type III secretion system ATPase, partial [Syntrophomonadaceae bacterium]
MNEPTPLQADKLIEMVEKLPVCSLKGRISQAIGLTLEATGPRLSLGELCYIRTNHGTGQYIP